MTKNKQLLLAIFLTSSISASCIGTGPIKETNHTVPADEIETAKVDLRMRAGELNCRGGSDQLMEARFLTTVESWVPDITYEVRGSRGILGLKQKKSKRFNLGKKKNIWELRFSDSIPLEMEMDLGAGTCRLDLTYIRLETLTIDIGVGELELRLPEDISDRVRVIVDGGIGSASIVIPEHVGARVEASGGLGSIDIDGMKKKGSKYFNNAFDYDKPYFDISIEGGIGSIEVKMR